MSALTERDQRLQAIREQVEVQHDLPLDVYPDVSDVEWLLAEIERLENALQRIYTIADRRAEYDDLPPYYDEYESIAGVALGWPDRAETERRIRAYNGPYSLIRT